MTTACRSTSSPDCTGYTGPPQRAGWRPPAPRCSRGSGATSPARPASIAPSSTAWSRWSRAGSTSACRASCQGPSRSLDEVVAGLLDDLERFGQAGAEVAVAQVPPDPAILRDEHVGEVVQLAGRVGAAVVVRALVGTAARSAADAEEHHVLDVSLGRDQLVVERAG